MAASRILFLALLACAPVGVAAPAAEGSKTPAGVTAPAATNPNEFDWRRFGESLAASPNNGVPSAKKGKAGQDPQGGKRGAALTRVHRLAEQTAEKLWALGIPPNYDEAGRKRAQAKFLDHTLGTCGHTAQCLKLVWTGAGLPDPACRTLVVLKRQADGQILPEINADHAAMVYLHPDGPVVFDLWCHGRSEQTFAKFHASAWKGMPVGEWARRMAKEGYTHASCQEHPDLGETPPLQLAELLRKLHVKDSQTAPANPSK